MGTTTESLPSEDFPFAFLADLAGDGSAEATLWDFPIEADAASVLLYLFPSG